MLYRSMVKEQLLERGSRIGDVIEFNPLSGKRKTIELKRNIIDFIPIYSTDKDYAMGYIKLPQLGVEKFHYRLELDNPSREGRFLLKTLKGQPFWLNGVIVKEAYIERGDVVSLENNRLNFGFKRTEEKFMIHSILDQKNLLESNLNIFIEGETGTGKTTLAEEIHKRSARLGSFIAINLSSLNPALIESELFGHSKGAFTGAHKNSKGAFEASHLGTLFLDEIDSLPLDLQVKLLTFLDTQKLRRVGEVNEVKVNTRLIFASGAKLKEHVEQGRFRKDLYYRIESGHSLKLLPLRESATRIKEICETYCLNQNISITPRLIEFYQTLLWPGNIRQLFGHLNKKKLLSKTLKLDFDIFDEELICSSSDLIDQSLIKDEIIPLDDLKRRYLKNVLMMSNGNYALAAKRLQIGEKTIKRILESVS